MNYLYYYLPVAFTLIVTLLNYRHFLKKHDDWRAFLLYFAWFFILFFLLPLLILAINGIAPLPYLRGIGFTWGKSSTGLPLLVVAVPFLALLVNVGQRDPEMKRQYPFSKQACTSLRRFVVFETAYLFLYYLPWEFLFRGILFFPIIEATNLATALAVQTIISTLMHIGHPESEIVGAMVGGFVFGLIAYSTGSFLYTWLIHGALGIGNDCFIYLTEYRKR